MTETGENYFSVIEDHFRAARGSPLFMFSPLDWALMDAWKSSGVPIEAVLRGIDVSFERWRKQPTRARTRGINSLNYCTSAIAEEAQLIANAAPLTGENSAPPFSLEEVRNFVRRNSAALRKAGHCDLARSLETIDLDTLYTDLEKLEQKLMAVEGALILRMRNATCEQRLLELGRELDHDLKPYRGKLTADQLEMLEEQLLDRRLLKSAGLPRLSLSYL